MLQITILSGINLKIPSLILLKANLFKLIYSKFIHSENIYDIYLTKELSKLYKSKEIRDVQLPNMKSINVTFEVSKLDKFNEVKDEQP